MTSRITAPAKLTTRLKITGTRTDGYHLIDAEMVSLDLCDEIVVIPGQTGIEVTGPYASGVPTDHTNLVQKALDLVKVSARVHIHKLIPHGGGLGGGSSDAAAILRWAGFDDLKSAAKIGADVAYCLVGGRAEVRGIGEIVTSLPHIPAHYTLIIPPLEVSTPAAYRAFDELCAKDPSMTEGLTNDLEPAALLVVPEMKVWKDRIAQLCGFAPTLAGSGATWFVPGDHLADLKSLTSHNGLVRVARTIEQT
jgi:4-diphosphocytidyl-2-C-methyl-D-erythritol kinase